MAYEFKEYPKWIVNQSGNRVIVKDKEEEDKVADKKEDKPKKPKGGW